MSVERLQDLVLRSRQHSFSLHAAMSLCFQLRMDYGGPVPLTYPSPRWVQIPFRPRTKEAAALRFESLTLSISTYKPPGLHGKSPPAISSKPTKPVPHQYPSASHSRLPFTAGCHLVMGRGCSARFPFQWLKCLSRNRALYVTAQKAGMSAVSSLRSSRTVESQLASLTCHRTFAALSLFTLLSHEASACARGRPAAGRFC